jgi:hypothetical protein
MATPIKQNLVNKNKAYAECFTGGSLALPPAKKYAVGISPPSLRIESPSEDTATYFDSDPRRRVSFEHGKPTSTRYLSMQKKRKEVGEMGNINRMKGHIYS